MKTDAVFEAINSILITSTFSDVQFGFHGMSRFRGHEVYMLPMV